jgi:hypothetical protein
MGSSYLAEALMVDIACCQRKQTKIKEVTTLTQQVGFASDATMLGKIPFFSHV